MLFNFSALIARLRAIRNFSNNKSNDGLGHNYEEYKGMGQLAINHLLETKAGQVKGAFFRYDLQNLTGTGEIDVAWGEVLNPKQHTGYGIAHILDKHGIKAVKMLGEIIRNGVLHKASNSRFKIKYKKYSVIISPEWKNRKRNIIISGFDTEDSNSKRK